MKRIFFVLFCACVCLAGCGQDQYAIERDYWKVNQKAQAIFKNPVATPPNEVERVVAQLNKFVSKYSKNTLAVRAGLSIGKLYLVKGQYEQARLQFKNMAKQYAKSGSVVAECLFLTGNTYQLQDQPDNAVAQYRTIISKYPLSQRGLQMPMYIAQYYGSRKEPQNMREAYSQAIAHYESLAQKDMKSALALRAYTLVAECYAGLKDWQQAIASLETIETNFKDKAPMDGVLLNIAIIYQRELRDKPNARATLQRIIDEYPKSRYVKAVQELLKK
ncbi:MAG: tetratricopeptide repeat protein [Methylobacter sp.]